MQAIAETLFDIVYLTTVITLGVRMIRGCKGNPQFRLFGIMAVVTSMYTMDKKNPSARQYLAKRADLLGAVRLPNNAFQANAGTGVTTDILFFQKRDHAPEREPDWVSPFATLSNQFSSSNSHK